jgi:hypothetical protein
MKRIGRFKWNRRLGLAWWLPELMVRHRVARKMAGLRTVAERAMAPESPWPKSVANVLRMKCCNESATLRRELRTFSSPVDV